MKEYEARVFPTKAQGKKFMDEFLKKVYNNLDKIFETWYLGCHSEEKLPGRPILRGEKQKQL